MAHKPLELCVDFLPLLAFASAARNAPCLPVVRSLAENALCGIQSGHHGTYTAKGVNALCEALKSTTTLTSLKYASNSNPPDTVNSL